MIHQLFKQAQDRYGVRGTELAKLAGISPNHLSDFRGGKKWVSEDVLCKLLWAMEELAPGSRSYFCQLLASESLTLKTQSVGERITELINVADEEDMEAAMIAIGKKWKREEHKKHRNNKFQSYREDYAEQLAI